VQGWLGGETPRTRRVIGSGACREGTNNPLAPLFAALVTTLGAALVTTAVTALVTTPVTTLGAALVTALVTTPVTTLGAALVTTLVPARFLPAVTLEPGPDPAEAFLTASLVASAKAANALRALRARIADVTGPLHTSHRGAIALTAPRIQSPTSTGAADHTNGTQEQTHHHRDIFHG
jgi:hypothetical protein